MPSKVVEQATTSSLTTYRKQRDNTQLFGNLVHTMLSIMAAPLKNFSSLSQRRDRSNVELGEPHEFCTRTFANVLWRLKLKHAQSPFKFSPKGARIAVE